MGTTLSLDSPFTKNPNSEATFQAVIDTNLLVAVVVEDDENHKRAISVWETISKAFVPTIVLFELAFFLVKYGTRTDWIRCH
jgi:predicted nucleic acid-binding protein